MSGAKARGSYKKISVLHKFPLLNYCSKIPALDAKI
jgi:hypothetical protein